MVLWQPQSHGLVQVVVGVFSNMSAGEVDEGDSKEDGGGISFTYRARVLSGTIGPFVSQFTAEVIALERLVAK